jgi:hypothetical protein
MDMDGNFGKSKEDDSIQAHVSTVSIGVKDTLTTRVFQADMLMCHTPLVAVYISLYPNITPVCP